MGIYLNSKTAYYMYKSEIKKPYFVDKTKMLQELFRLVYEGTNYICITRPRRFGKTMMANMISSFFGMENDSGSIFDKLEIAEHPEYRNNLNQYNVFHIDFSRCGDGYENFTDYINDIKRNMKEDLLEKFPKCRFRDNVSISEALEYVLQQYGIRFIFVLDEWDAIFHMAFVKPEDKQSYLLFLKNLLKDRPYVLLAYMTGILPIAKYSSGSELNMFWEYSMATQAKYSEYFGFTEKEVDKLYEKYLMNTPKPTMFREDIKTWYDGYHVLSGERIYNPRSVVLALSNNQIGSYWTSSGPYDEIFYYIEKNVDEVRDSLAVMLTGEGVKAKVQEYAATSTNLNTKDEIFSAMVVYGFLTYKNGKVYIPNKELMDKFAAMIQKENSLGYVNRLARESDRMLAATKAGDTKTMAEILSYAHDTESPLLSYNREAELSAIVNLVYLSARDEYDIQREDKSGIGYVDFIFYPKLDFAADCLILELKVDKTPEDALAQIREKKYALRFKGKLAEKPQYTGRILAVGIGYDKETKVHECKVEILE